ncbi:MAG TPA: hypothetical protein VNK24_05365 [Elusimicrobiota bacterium]|nr:hypothetical protein [Elusimicrobiota bacterium]
MKHENFLELFDELRDSELGEPLKGELSVHLASCVACRQDYECRAALFKRFFHPVEAPAPAQIEAFTRAVMGKIPAVKPGGRAVQDAIPENELASWAAGRARAWRNLWWVVPSLGFALAAFILALHWSAPALMVPLDSQLLIGAKNKGVAEMVIPLDPANGQNLVAVEEQ